jgi:hypothetical protein
MFARIILGVTCLVLFWINTANALQMIAHDGIYFYFPKGQYAKAAELLDACEPIDVFLKKRGMPPTKPLHIILDENLDEPKVRISMIPHHEIRIPLRAPGVLEDGANEADPWQYFLFMGLCTQGIFSQRSGIPGGVHTLFGEIISPNIILPEWGIDGIGFYLYEQYRQTSVPAPFAKAILDSGPIPDLDIVSNHPDVWPGRFSYRIYGRPFRCWLARRYGWDKLLEFIRLHGRGIIPVAIDNEAQTAFGQSWNQLWQAFRKEHAAVAPDRLGRPIVGYWYEPFVYWNEAGMHPGLQRKGWRGRYGYADSNGWLLLSEYNKRGISKLRSLRQDQLRKVPDDHIWDPGPGKVAVSRRGSRPYLIFLASLDRSFLFDNFKGRESITRWIEAPPDVIQLSGPVMDDAGRIAVAGNTAGNWDIWLYDGTWHRITTAPSIEMDPWFQNGHLIFASNISGHFQIHSSDMRQLTHSATAAVLPRGRTYLELGPDGWSPKELSSDGGPPLDDRPATEQTDNSPPPPSPEKKENADYSPFKSLIPDYVIPDIFIDTSNLQIGLSTEGRDVSGNFALDTGVRYSANDNFFSWRLGGKAHNWIARTTRYPFSFTTARQVNVDEHRYDSKLGWLPFSEQPLEVSMNWRYYTPQSAGSQSQNEWWGSVHFLHAAGNWRTQATVDLFTKGSQSIYGDAIYLFGERINTQLRLEAGKTWGDLISGHTTFRVGGGAGEGFFTQRPTRLFPIRGFDENVLNAGQAVAGSIETFWPLFYLQTGYKTLPLFLRNVRLGTFVDSGFASEHVSANELLVGAGFELITGLEVAWGFDADFRIAFAWPLKQPDDLNQKGPKFIIQIGKPL